MKILALLFVLVASPSFAATYYVDFATGADTNNGTSTATPWKHSPSASTGDPDPTNNANITLAAGDTVVFKGGVAYNGRIDPNASGGGSGSRITFISGDRFSPAWGTGKAIIDGQVTRKYGFQVNGRSWIDIEGFEIRNMGAPTSGASGIYFVNSLGANANNRVLYCTIYDINRTGGAYVIGYGILNDLSTSHIYEYNDIYNVPDKCIELAGGGGRGTNATDAIIRYNRLHNSLVHLVVLTSDNAEVYNNIMWESHDGSFAGAPGPGYCVKIDQGTGNKVYNNLCYNVSAGLGVLAGDNNLFYSNTIYGVNASGAGATENGENALNLEDDSSHTGWTAPVLQGNEFKNNIIYYIPGATQPSAQLIFFTAADGGSNNKIQNNLFLKASGDTMGTVNRVRRRPVGGSYTYSTLTDLEANFNTQFGGSGNVASGNVVADPSFIGGLLGSLSSKPTSFSGNTPTPNGFEIPTGSAAKDIGLTLGNPYNTDISGVSRPQGALYDAGPYEYQAPGEPTTGNTGRRRMRR